ncbi:MAG: bacterial Ig-like domain-containing protein, partial [Firmicutes bacterium]|nr:bacterial Ig-like domain-containing protein [Bacillota bacterium]
MKKFLPLLLILGVLIILTTIPASAETPDFSVKLLGALDTATKFEDRNTLTLDWQIMANKTALKLRSAQGINFAYDNEVLQLVTWNASAAISDASWKLSELTRPTWETTNNNAGLYNFGGKISCGKTSDGKTCFIALEVGDDIKDFTCPVGSYFSLGKIRFAFRAGKSAANLNANSIRILTLTELNNINQSCNLLINTADFPNKSYIFGEQYKSVYSGNDNLEAPLIELPKPILYGDVNGDERINPADLTRLQQYISGVDRSTNEFNVANADVNGDGVVNPGDLTRFQLYISGVDRSPLGPPIILEISSAPPLTLKTITAKAAVAAADPMVRVSNVSGKAGEEVTLAISFENNPGIAFFGLTLQYDKNKLTYIRSSLGDIIKDNWLVLEDFYNNHSLTFSASVANGVDSLTGSTLFTVTFKIKEGTSSGIIKGTDLLLDYLDMMDGFTSDRKFLYYNITQGEITVEPDKALLNSIEVTTLPTKKDYFVGEAFNTAGMIVTAKYSDGSSKAITGFTTAPANGAILNNAGAQNVMVSYTEEGITKTANFTVTVNAITLQSIKVSTLPTKTSYFVGETLNTAGMVVSATYNDSSSKTVTG